MIGRLRGRVLEKSPPSLTLDISGIGFLVSLPLSSFEKIEEGQEIIIFTRFLIKDESAYIYGFLTKEELQIFEQLISVSGVGPKSALNLLSRFSPEEVKQAIESEDIGLISSVPKLGKRIAAKIILDLKGNLCLTEKPTVFNQAVAALISLGLSRAEAIQRLTGLPNILSLEELVKEALRRG